MTEERINTCEGKYTAVLRADGSSTALRYGQEWPAYAGVHQLDNLTVALARDLQAARAMVKECGEQFRFYQKNHEAKGTPDADAKAKVNAEIAARCEALVSA